MVGIFPAATAGPFLGAAVRAVVGPEVPAYSLEVWHGITIPLLMSLAALVGGALLSLVLRRYLRQGAEGPPLLRRLDSVPTGRASRRARVGPCVKLSVGALTLKKQ